MHHLDMIQHSAARLCFNNYSKEPGVVTDMFNKLEWLSLKGRRILSQLSMFHQIVYQTVDIDKDSYLTPLPYTSRSGNFKTFMKTTFKLQSISIQLFSVVSQPNRLPGDIVNIDDNLKFKVALCDHLIETGKWF